MVELEADKTYQVYYEHSLGWGRYENLDSTRAIALYDEAKERTETSYAEIVCIEDGEIKIFVGTKTRD